MYKMDELIKLKERIINVALKADTKKELDKIGSKRDSYDDVIRKLIHIYYQQASKQLDEDRNRILLIKKLKRKESTISVNGVKVKYTHNIPSNEGLTNYTFDIECPKLFKKENKLILIKQTNLAIGKILIYTKIIEKIIQTHIDPLFRLEKNNRNRLNLTWWDRKLKNLGLSHDTFKRDIEEKFILLGAI